LGIEAEHCFETTTSRELRIATLVTDFVPKRLEASVFLSECAKPREYKSEQIVNLTLKNISRNGFGKIGEEPNRLLRQRIRWMPDD